MYIYYKDYEKSIVRSKRRKKVFPQRVRVINVQKVKLLTNGIQLNC